MLYVEGRVVAPGRAWTRRAGAVQRVDDAAAVAALEEAGGWDHVVLVGPAGASEARAAAAFDALDDLLAQAGPTLLFGGVALPGRFRTAYADRDTAAGRAPAIADSRDALLRALRGAAREALGPPMRVTVGLFGAAATRRVGRALADAVEQERWGAIQLATAAAGLLGPERIETILMLEGDEPAVAIAALADQLRDVLEPYPEPRRQALLLDLWRTVDDGRATAAERERKLAWAKEIAGEQPDDPSAWLREVVTAELEPFAESWIKLVFEHPAWLASAALDHAIRNAVAALVLVRLALAERDGHWDEEVAAVTPLAEVIGEWGRSLARWSGPACRRLSTLRVEEANRADRPRPNVSPEELLWPPLDRRSRLVGAGWEASSAIETVNDAVAWCRRSITIGLGWWAYMNWQEQIDRDPRRTTGDGGWTWRYWFAPRERPPLAERAGTDDAAEDALDGLWLAQLADLIGELAGVGPVLVDADQDRFRFQPPVDAPRDPLRPLRTSVASAAAGAAQLVRLGGQHPPQPRSWSALEDALMAVGVLGDAEDARDLRYPPELAALHGRRLEGTDLLVIVPHRGDEVVGWGTWMANCIGSYVDDARAGRSFVFALTHRDEVPVVNLELVPSADGYLVGELKARFNAEPAQSIVDAVERLRVSLPAPTRPWPARRRPGPRHPRGGGGGEAADRVRRPRIAAAVEAACLHALAEDEEGARADLAALLRAGAACGATVATPAAAATAINRMRPDRLADVVRAELHGGIASLWAFVATDWVGEAMAALSPDLAADASALRLLDAAPRPSRRRGPATPATDALRAVATAAAATAAALGDLVERRDEELAKALDRAPGPATLALLLAHSAIGPDPGDIGVPVDAAGLVRTRPPTHVHDPHGPWATAWRVAGLARPAAVARLWRRLVVRGAAGELFVPREWLGGTWSRWATRAAPQLAGLGGGWAGVTDRLVALAGDPLTPAATLAALAELRADVAARVALNPSTSPAARRRLSRHPDPLVAAAAALYKPGFEDAAEWCAAGVTGTAKSPPEWDWPDALPSGLQVRLSAALADSPSTPVAALAARLARQPAVLARLATHPSTAVRRIVAAKDAAPAEVVAALAVDPDFRVRCELAERGGRLPPDIIRRYARDEARTIRAAVAARRDTPLAVLERLAADRVDSVRDAALANPRLRPRSEAREAVDPDAPPARLAELARSDLVATRRLVAAHPATPVSALAALAHLDPDAGVRAAAHARR